MELNLLDGDDLKSQYLNNIEAQFYHLDRIDELQKQFNKSYPYNRSDKEILTEMFNMRVDEHQKAINKLKKINVQIDTKINKYDNINY